MISKGFSLIEIVAVVALLALIAAIALPRITKRRLSLGKQLLQELNHLTRTAQTSAMMTGKLHRVVFDIKNGKLQIEVDSGKKDSLGTVHYIPLKIPYVTTSVPLNPDLDIDQFMIKGKNKVHHGEGIHYTGAWFYIVPEGLTQEVSITIKERNSPKTYSMVINPFTAIFSAG